MVAQPFERLSQAAEGLADEGDSPENIRRLRVAARRCVRFLKGSKDPPVKILRRLKRLRRDLARIRKQDVRSALWLEACEKPGIGRTAAVREVAGVWQGRRVKAVKRARLVKALAKILVPLDTLTTALPGEAMVELVRGRLWRWLAKADKWAGRARNELGWHKLRLLIKEMRDTAASVITGWDNKGLRRLLKGMQTELGDYREREMLRATLKRVRSEGSFSKSARELAAQIARGLKQEDRQRRNAFLSAWRGRKARLEDILQAAADPNLRAA